MVLLDENRVVQTHAVVFTAAAAHGVFLRGAQARQGFAGVEDDGARTGHGLHVTTGDGGGAGQGLQEIERRALAGKQGARRAFERAQHLVGAHGLGVVHQPFHANPAIELAEDLVKPGLTAKYRVVTRDDLCLRRLAGGNQRRGEVAAAEILFQCAADDGVDVFREHLHQPHVEQEMRPDGGGVAERHRPGPFEMGKKGVGAACLAHEADARR
jgi:hypothetical protein